MNYENLYGMATQAVDQQSPMGGGSPSRTDVTYELQLKVEELKSLETRPVSMDRMFSG